MMGGGEARELGGLGKLTEEAGAKEGRETGGASRCEFPM